MRQQRMIAFFAACAIVVGSAGAAVAATGNDRADPPIADQDAPPTSTTTTTTEPASTTTTSTTSPARGCAVSCAAARAAGPTTTVDSTPVDVKSEDLTGTIALASTTWHAEQENPVTVTIRNASNHPVILRELCASHRWGAELTGLVDPAKGTPLAPNETRTLVGAIKPKAPSIGVGTAYVGFVYGWEDRVSCEPVAGVPEVPVSIVPPGWAPGQPLDPMMGSWTATMSAGTVAVTVDDAVVLHATITNTGDEPQNTDAFTALGFVCNLRTDPDDDGIRLGDALLLPGQTKSFSYEFPPGKWPVGKLSCWVGIKFKTWPYGRDSGAHVDTDKVVITVLPPAPATTTTTTTLPPHGT